MLLCAILLAGTLLTGPVQPPLTAYAASQADIDALQKKKDAKLKEIEEDKKKIKQLQTAQASAANEQAAVQKLINNNQALIDICSDQLAALTSQISTLEKNITDAQARIDKNKQLFKDRLRTMYMTGSYSDLEVLLGAESFSDLLLKTELLRKVSEHDSTLINSINDALTQLNADKAEVAAKKSEQEGVKKTLSAKRAELSTQYKQKASLTASINAQKTAAQKEKDANQKEVKAIEENMDDIRRILNASKNDGVFKDGQFAWPVPTCYNITSNYGSRWGRLHAGMDISRSKMNEPIIAAADGVVIKASDTGNGYGKCVIINHGKAPNGKYYSTLYGHNNQILVSVGQSVTRGQRISLMGNTGRVSGVTGIHLHFEIWQGTTANNMKAVNPASFFR